MGNKPTRKAGSINRTTRWSYAISALKDRPGSTQDDVFDYLENKYEGRIPPRAKKNLETVIRSVIKTKNSRRGGGRPTRSTGCKVRFKAKVSGPVRRRPGRVPGRPKVRKLITRPGKDSQDSHFREEAANARVQVRRASPSQKSAQRNSQKQ